MISSTLFYSIGEEEGICFVLGIDYFLSDQMKVTTVTAFKCRLAIADTISLVHKQIVVVAEVTIFFSLQVSPHHSRFPGCSQVLFFLCTNQFVQLKVQYIMLCCHHL